jgi:hemerythrin HHE cation binding domain-containing protein
MNRFDIYRFVHKALRALMFDTVASLAATDFADAGQARAAGEAAARLVAVLRGHGEHEDAFVMPLVAVASPATFAALQADHERVDALHDGLAARLAALADAAAAERPAIGRDIATDLHRLVACHLEHMEREERVANPALWGRFSDAELVDAQRRLIAHVPPDELTLVMGLMMRAISPAERAALQASA